jgi:hypothetical protein
MNLFLINEFFYYLSIPSFFIFLKFSNTANYQNYLSNHSKVIIIIDKTFS